MTRNVLRYCVFLCFALFCAGCSASLPIAQTPTRPPIPTLRPTVPASTPTSAPTQGSDWQTGAPGVELRRMRVAPAPQRPPAELLIARLDPAHIRLRVAYAPDQPRPLHSWFADERPLLAINGGFFTPEYRTTALLMSDGTVSGASYEGFGGMLASAPDGTISLRALSDQPYDPSEVLDQALQSFPMLVFPGGVAAHIEDDGRRARRSVVALDRAGRLLLLVCPGSDFTLRELADWLSSSDLDIERALNLDGGSSTGLYIDDGSLHVAIDSFGPLPIVLLVEQR